MFNATLPARFWSKVDKRGPAECWPWTAAKSVGYGRIAISTTNGRSTFWFAHRISYVWANGPIPDGMEIDHACLNRGCVNPRHLRLASHKQNQENRPQRQSNNTSGYRWVYWNRGRWLAHAKHRGRTYSAGSFENIEDAARAVAALRAELFTHSTN